MDESVELARARHGDSAAFAAIYDRHAPAVYALALRLTGQAADAQDVTQDVFVLAWRKLQTFDGSAKLSTWLHGIAVRVCRQRWRTLARRLVREDGGGAYLQALSSSMPTADLDVERAIAALPDRMRTALVLHALHGYSQSETAAMMGIAEGSVKAHVHRARQLMREKLDEHG